MKKLLTSLALIALVALPLAAQNRFEPATIFTIQLPPASASNVASIISVGRDDVIGLQLTCVASNPAACWNGADATNITAWLSESVDGINYTGIKYPVGLLVNTSTVYGTFTAVTNLTITGRGYLKVNYITNQMSIAHITNVTLKVGYKGNR